MKPQDPPFVVRLPFEEWVVRVARPPLAPNAAQKLLVERVIAAFRFGLDQREPRLVDLAQRIVQQAEGGGPVLVRRPGSGLSDASFASELLQRLAALLRSGRLHLEQRQLTALGERPELAPPALPPLPPPRRESPTHSFELRLLDEVGQGIPGIAAEFSADGVREVPTNAAGVALLEGVKASSASVLLADAEALAAVLEPRWQKPRLGAPPQEANLQTVVFRGLGLGPFTLKAEVPNTVVVTPPRGKLFIELWDKRGRARHANRRYSITGPATFSGVTDAEGRIEHDSVPGGDYELTLFLEPGSEEPSFEAQTLVVPLVTLAPAEATPQVRFVGAVPSVVLARLLGAFFDTSKSFLLPAGVESLVEVEDLFRDNNPSQLLVVGHTDTTADPATNDPLSLERAKMTLAFFRDDVDVWLGNYQSVPAGALWGAREDHAMLEAVSDVAPELAPAERIREYQKSRSLTVDGIAGKQTRRQLIQEYMALDAATLNDPGFDIPPAPHGCGEHFPLADSADSLDGAAADATDDAFDRRVELFFFDRDLGVQPPAPGKNSPQGSTQYPEWRKQAQSTLDVKLEPPRRIQLVDEQGVPLELEPYEIVTEDGQVIPGVADAEGIVTIPPGVGNEVTLRLTSLVPEVQLEAI